MTTQATPVILAHRLHPEMEESASSDIQRMFMRALSVLSRRRWLFIAPVMTGLWLSLAVGLAVPRRYYVTALFEREDDVVISKLVADSSPYSFGTLRRSMNMDLKGYQAVATAVEQLGLTDDFPRDAQGHLTGDGQARKHALVNTLVEQLHVTLREKGESLDLVEVSYIGTDPDLGAGVINQLKNNYMETAQSRVDELLASAYEFFGREMDRSRRQVVELEDELIREAVEHPGVRPSNPDLIDQQLMRQEQALASLQQERAKTVSEIEARQVYLRELARPEADESEGASEPRAPAPSAMPNTRHAQLARQLKEAQDRITDTKTTRQMTDHHPEIVALRRQLETVQREFESCPEWITPSVPLAANVQAPVIRDPSEAERKRAEVELRSLRENLVRIDDSIRRHEADKAWLENEKVGLVERRQNYMLRQQDLENTKNELSLWKGHVDQINRIRTAKAENRGIKFATIENARRPGKPFSPTLSGIYALSAGIAVALGAIILFLREVLDRSLRDPERIRSVIGVPVLEAIGEITAGRASRWLTGRRVLQAVAVVQAVLVAGMGILVYLSMEKPLVYEAVVGHVAGLAT